MMKKGWLLLLLLPIVLLGIANIIYLNTRSEPRTAPQSAETSKVVQTPTQEQKPTVDELLRLTNEKRAKAGIAPLQLDQKLNQSAQAKADDMVSSKYYGHVNPATGVHGVNIIPSFTSECRSGAENIDAATTSKETVQEWYDSPLHRKALLDPAYQTVGYGIAFEGSYYYVVQHFCDLW